MILIIKHVSIEGPGTLGDFLQSTSHKIKIVELERNQILPSVEKCDAIISMGGPMNVYETEKYPFLLEEENLLKDALKKQIPILGICLGAQLLAKVSGAGVKKAAQKEIGWYKVNLTQEAKADPLFEGIDTPLEIFQWHEDTFDIPKDGILLGTSETCKNQAFRVNQNSWGLQFHPEIDDMMLESWFDNNSEGLDKKAMLDGYYKRKDLYQHQAQSLYNNFLKNI